MKRFVTILAVAAAAFLCACSCERASVVVPEAPEVSEAPETPGSLELREIVLSARSGDVQTKSSRDEAGTFYWSPGDEISLFRGTGSEGGWKLTSTNTEPATSAEFKGSVSATEIEGTDGKYLAVYPYNVANSFDGSVLTTVVPSAQTAKAGSFADKQFISVGYSDNLSMDFYHLCGGIKFKVENTGITQITLSGNNGEILAGTVKVAIDGEGHPVVNEVVDGATEVTLTAPEGGFIPGKEYFIVTLPVEFSRGFTIGFGSGLTRTVTASMPINRAKFQWSNSALDCQFDIAYETGNIENSGTKAFLNDVTYTDSDYTVSSIKSYRDRYGRSNATDDPLPVKLNWSGSASSVVMSTSPLFDSNVTDISFSGTSANVYNLVPGVKYYYKVLSSGGNVLKLACVTAMGEREGYKSWPLRMIYGIADNVRDLGGWAAANGSHVAYGKIYRGAKLDGISDSGKDIFLNKLGISVDLDLRGSKSDEDEAPVFPQTSVEYRMIPVVKNLGEGTGDTQELYQQAIREVIGWLGQGKAIYCHCAGGADRTGTLIFLIEALLGVSESDMSKDYELTTYDWKNLRERNARRSSETHVLYETITHLRKFGPEGTDVHDLVLTWAKTRHSEDVDPLTDEEIADLREYMLVN